MTTNKVFDFVKALLKKMKEDYVNAFSAQAAFFIIISIFPFIMFLLTMIQSVYNESTLLRIITDITPHALDPYVISTITKLYDQTSGTIISVSALTTLWSASKAILAIIKGLNSVYDIDENRNYIKLRIIAVAYTFAFALMIIISLGFLVFGNQLYVEVSTRFPVLNEIALLFISLRTIVGLCILTAFFTVLYKSVPNRKTKALKELPGAILAAVGWMGFSYIYSFYIDNMSNSNMYGNLTAIVFLMLWLYFCMYILFIGAEFNVIWGSRFEQ